MAKKRFAHIDIGELFRALFEIELECAGEDWTASVKGHSLLIAIARQAVGGPSTDAESDADACAILGIDREEE